MPEDLKNKTCKLLLNYYQVNWNEGIEEIIL